MTSEYHNISIERVVHRSVGFCGMAKSQTLLNYITLKLKTNIPTHENIYTIPNILTFSRLLASPYIGYLIVQGSYPLALGIFAVAGITDMVSLHGLFWDCKFKKRVSRHLHYSHQKKKSLMAILPENTT